MESGSGLIIVDDEKFSLLPGSCVAVEAGVVHEVINNGTGELVLSYFGLRVEKK